MALKTSGNKLAENLIRLLEEIAQSEGFTSYEIERTGGTQKGDRLVGEISYIDIKGTSSCGQPKVLQLVLKCAFSDESIREIIPISDIYLTEINVYEKVFPLFMKFQVGKNISDRFTGFPKCYRTVRCHLEECLVLHDMKSLGYIMWDRTKPMDENHVALILQEYGKFHGTSFALKDQKRDEFNKISSEVHNAFVTQIDMALPAYVENIEHSLTLFDSEKDRKIVEELKEFKKILKDFVVSLFFHKDDFSVFVHGDCWCNNMMFKYEKSSSQNEPSQVCFLDFQITSVSSVVTDIAYFFYCCATDEMIENDFDKYMNIYYKSLSNHISKLGSDPQKLYPREKFDEEWKRFSRFGYVFALTVIRIMYSQTTEVVDLKDGDTENFISFKRIRDQDRVDNKLKTIVRHLSKNNWL